MARYFLQPYKNNPFCAAVNQLVEHYQEMVESSIGKIPSNQSQHPRESVIVMDRKENKQARSNLANWKVYRLDYQGLEDGQREFNYAMLAIQLGRKKNDKEGNAAQVHFQCGIEFTLAELIVAFGISLEHQSICRMTAGEPRPA